MRSTLYPEPCNRASLRELMTAPPTPVSVFEALARRRTEARRRQEERRDAERLGLDTSYA